MGGEGGKIMERVAVFPRVSICHGIRIRLGVARPWRLRLGMRNAMLFVYRENRFQSFE